MLPSLFVSHGSPTLPFDDIPARTFLKGLGASLPKPKAIVIATAHWETRAPAVNRVAVNGTIHDFTGFPKPLYELTYPAHIILRYKLEKSLIEGTLDIDDLPQAWNDNINLRHVRTIHVLLGTATASRSEATPSSQPGQVRNEFDFLNVT